MTNSCMYPPQPWNVKHQNRKTKHKPTKLNDTEPDGPKTKTEMRRNGTKRNERNTTDETKQNEQTETKHRAGGPVHGWPNDG